MEKKPKAIIFDMDGLLIDSMQYFIDEDDNFLRSFNIELTKDIIRRFSGQSEEENMSWIKETYGLKHSVAELQSFRGDFTQKIYSDKSQIMPGVDELMKKIKQIGLKRAIASGAPLKNIKTVVERFGWQDYFHALVSPDLVDFVGKPNPRVYLYAAERLGVLPEECLVFEDAENGVVAAKRAGMICVAVPDKRWSFGDFSQADLIVKSLADEKINKFLNI